METVIEFVADPTTGEQPVLEFIRQLAVEGRNDPDKMQLYKLIIRGLDFLKRYGLQESFKKYFETHSEDGKPYTIMLVKPLRNHVPLIEFRVNWKAAGAFRAVFFEHQIDDTRILLFVQSVVKQTTHDLKFERIVQETETVHSNFLLHPEQYINLLGDGKP
ncbi:hypothetical protein J7E73_29205 [Paenibacillus albidus]|uniref:hypothetical protein n=1 Tax=Paenibacillus albidus TaxID=2041023 RepID=UPI001BEC2D41|nr:hypothetical protein [Paenibacillus albidus]MBT2293120.1 hypothetical protein [Paenibacillus albidus]